MIRGNRQHRRGGIVAHRLGTRGNTTRPSAGCRGCAGRGRFGAVCLRKESARRNAIAGHGFPVQCRPGQVLASGFPSLRRRPVILLQGPEGG